MKQPFQEQLEQALALYMEGRHQEALTLYRHLLLQDPENAQAHCGLGEVLEALGRPGEALLAFDRALELAPDLAWAHFGRGGVLQGLRRYGEATAAYRQAAELLPGEVAFHRVLGVVLYLQDRLEESLAAYRRALEVEPEDALSHYGLGLVLDALGRPEAAFLSYTEAVRCDPDDPWPHLRLAGLLQRLSARRPEAAGPGQSAVQKHLWQATLLLEEKDHWGHTVLATLQGRTQEAMRRLRLAVTRLPESADWLRRDPDLVPLQADERFWLALLAGGNEGGGER